MQKIKINNFDDQLYYHQLDNGLKIYLFYTPNKNSNCAYFGTKFGGSYIDYEVNKEQKHVIPGTAHFLEHKLFEQENGESALEYFSKNGASCNAWTAKDVTCYFFQSCNNFIENLEYLINYVSNPYLTDDNVEKEKGIINEEIKMYLDDPDDSMFNILMKNMYFFDTTKASIAGTYQDIKKITKSSLLECYNTFYHPSNMFLIIAGSFDKDKIIKIVEKECFNRKKIDFVKTKHNEPNNVVKEYEQIFHETKNTKFIVGFKIDKKDLQMDKYMYSYYGSLLYEMGFGRASLFRDKMNKKNLFNYFYGYSIECENHLSIIFVGESKKHQQFIDELLKAITKLKFDEQEFERIKRVWISSEIRMIEDNETTARNIINDVVSYGEYKNNRIEDIKNLQFNEMINLYKRINWDNKSIVVLSPRNDKK